MTSTLSQGVNTGARRVERRTIAALVLIIAIGALLRGYAVVDLPFLQDEMYSINQASLLFETDRAVGIKARPVFFLLQHLIVETFPHTPIVLRALPFVFGVLGLVATWILARSVLEERAALATTLFAAISPWHLFASGYSRYYSLVYLLAAMAYRLLPRAYDTDRPRYHLAASAVLLVGGFTHPSFVFPVAAAVLVVMAVRADGSISWRWPTRNGWLFLWIPFVVSATAAFIVISIVHPTGTITNLSSRGLVATLRLIPAMVDLTTPIVVVAASMGALSLLAVARRRRFGAMVIACSAVTFGALGLLSTTTGVYADYGIALLPLMFVGAGGLLQWVEDMVPSARRFTVVAATVALILVGMLPSTLSFLSDGSRFDYRPAYAAIAQEAPQLPVLTWPTVLQRRYAPQLDGRALPRSARELEAILRAERRVWVVSSVREYGLVKDASGRVSAWLLENCRQHAQFKRPRFDQRLYRVDLWLCDVQDR